MADLVFKNFASTTLAFDLNIGDDTALVVDGSVFPDAPSEGEFAVVVEDASARREIGRCTSRSGNSMTLLRAQEGTAEQGFSAGAVIELRYTAGSMDEYFSRKGYDGGVYTEGASAERQALQMRRNTTEPLQAPDDLYEGELAVNLSTAVPALYVGPTGAENDGEGLRITDIIATDDVEPINAFDNLLWLNVSTFEVRVYRDGGWQGIKVSDVHGKEYALKSYVDGLIATEQGKLNAPSGTRMVFAQAAAPTGWVKDTASNDRMLRVVSGTSGGSHGGSWTISGMSVGSHALTLAQLPAHNHGGGSHNHTYTQVNGVELQKPGGTGVGFVGIAGSFSGTTSNENKVVVNTEGSNNGHTHSLSSDATWRPLYVDTIIAVKS